MLLSNVTPFVFLQVCDAIHNELSHNSLVGRRSSHTQRHALCTRCCENDLCNDGCGDVHIGKVKFHTPFKKTALSGSLRNVSVSSIQKGDFLHFILQQDFVTYMVFICLLLYY